MSRIVSILTEFIRIYQNCSVQSHIGQKKGTKRDGTKRDETGQNGPGTKQDEKRQLRQMTEQQEQEGELSDV